MPDVLRKLTTWTRDAAMLNAAGLSIRDVVIACQLLLRLRFRIVGRVDRGEEGRTNERKDACRSVRSLAVVNADKRWAGT